MDQDEMLAKIKYSLRMMDNIIPRALDKTDPRYSQPSIDRLYNEFKRLKGEVVNKLASQITESERGNYETLLRDLDDHIAMVEPYVSNGLGTSGGKRRNKRSYKKSRRSNKKTRRCRKKTRRCRKN